jgi:putative redox protein
MPERPSAEKPRALVELVWEHDLVLSGQSGGVQMTLDSESEAGPSPMQALAFALAGCMSMDVVHVIQKGRYNLRGLRADLSATRAPTEPRRFTAISLHFIVTGDVPREKVERAIQLSREKYCSVWHSMREDIELDVTYAVTPGI